MHNAQPDTNSPATDGTTNHTRAHYLSVLGLALSAEEEEIKAAYRRLAMRWHPDKNPSPDATSKFQEISYAYRKLIASGVDTDDEVEFSAEDIFLSVFGPLFRFGRNSKTSKVVSFNMADFVCPHHREYASRFFESSSDSEWDSEDSYYDYEYDTDDEDEEEEDDEDDSDSDFFYSFHTHPPQKQPKPKEPGVPDRPAPPKLVNATDVSLKVGWEPPANNGAPILAYILEMDVGVVAGANFNEVYRGKKRSYEVKRLTPGTTYHFLVKATNKFGAGGFSRVASFITQGPSPKKGSSKAPTENGATSSTTSRKKRKAKKAEALTNELNIRDFGAKTTKVVTGVSPQDRTAKSNQPKQATLKAKKTNGTMPQSAHTTNLAQVKTPAKQKTQLHKQSASNGMHVSSDLSSPSSSSRSTNISNREQQRNDESKVDEEIKLNGTAHKRLLQQRQKHKQTLAASKEKHASEVATVKATHGAQSKAKATQRKQDRKTEAGKYQGNKIESTCAKKRFNTRVREEPTEQIDESASEGEEQDDKDTTEAEDHDQDESEDDDEEVVVEMGGIVRVKGLPWSATEEDIANFFDGLSIDEDGICIALDFEGRPTGDALVSFTTRADANRALDRHMKYIGRRYICVEPSQPGAFTAARLFASAVHSQAPQTITRSADPDPVRDREPAVPDSTQAQVFTDEATSDSNHVPVLGSSELLLGANLESTSLATEFSQRVASRSTRRTRARVSRSGASASAEHVQIADPATTRALELQALLEMGFGENEAAEALRKNQNPELTVEWLLQRRAEKERKGERPDSVSHFNGHANKAKTLVPSGRKHEAHIRPPTKVVPSVLPHQSGSAQSVLHTHPNVGAVLNGQAHTTRATLPRTSQLHQTDHVRMLPHHAEERSAEPLNLNVGVERPRIVSPPPSFSTVTAPPVSRIYPVLNTAINHAMNPGLAAPGSRGTRLDELGRMQTLVFPVAPLVNVDAAREKQLSSSLWIGNVSGKVREDELRSLFTPFGEIVSLKILRHSQCAFVNYSTPAAATHAKRLCQGKLLRDMRLEINFSKPPKAQRRDDRANNTGLGSTIVDGTSPPPSQNTGARLLRNSSIVSGDGSALEENRASSRSPAGPSSPQPVYHLPLDEHLAENSPSKNYFDSDNNDDNKADDIVSVPAPVELTGQPSESMITNSIATAGFSQDDERPKPASNSLDSIDLNLPSTDESLLREAELSHEQTQNIIRPAGHHEQESNLQKSIQNSFRWPAGPERNSISPFGLAPYPHLLYDAYTPPQLNTSHTFSSHDTTPLDDQQRLRHPFSPFLTPYSDSQEHNTYQTPTPFSQEPHPTGALITGSGGHMEQRHTQQQQQQQLQQQTRSPMNGLDNCQPLDTDEPSLVIPPPAAPTSYGLFGWQPKPFGSESLSSAPHLSMNIWGTSQLYPPSSSASSPSFSSSPSHYPHHTPQATAAAPLHHHHQQQQQQQQPHQQHHQHHQHHHQQHTQFGDPSVYPPQSQHLPQIYPPQHTTP
eukprot:TRINITY_DN3187_c0_g1_i1.p1 TRINITY_DN3187_c0_g1~~TRINITY_DN3187_c0_g1_i1.p1  ORF type:complete len:1507 (+),score=271.77 TRINITY_DN3187_c0_g1_i1:222-4742(+)